MINQQVGSAFCPWLLGGAATELGRSLPLLTSVAFAGGMDGIGLADASRTLTPVAALDGLLVAELPQVHAPAMALDSVLFDAAAPAQQPLQEGDTILLHETVSAIRAHLAVREVFTTKPWQKRFKTPWSGSRRG